MQVPNLEAEVRTDRTQYPPRRAVEIATRLTNTGDILKVIEVRTGFEAEIAVRDDRSGRVVWTWSKGRPRQRAYAYRLAPGESRLRRELWDRRDDEGRPVPPGVYRVEATLVPLRQPVATQIHLMGSEDGPGGGRPGEAPPSPSPSPGDGLVGSLRADRAVVRPGETVSFVYTVANRSREARTLRFRSGQRFDIEVARRPEPNARYAKGALTVWQLSREMFYTLALGEMTFAPGETKSFPAQWRVPAGIPTAVADARAWLTGRDLPETAPASVPLRLVGG